MQDGKYGSGGVPEGKLCAASSSEAGRRPTSTSRCSVCGSPKPPVFVHGHHQCQDCKSVADGDCCQGSPL